MRPRVFRGAVRAAACAGTRPAANNGLREMWAQLWGQRMLCFTSGVFDGYLMAFRWCAECYGRMFDPAYQ